MNKGRTMLKRELSERQETMERVKKNGVLYKKVVLVIDFLMKGSAKKSDLLDIIIPKIKENKMHVDRILRRNKQAIYCWICENIHLFPHIESLVNVQWPFEEPETTFDFDEIDYLTDPDPLNDDFLL